MNRLIITEINLTQNKHQQLAVFNYKDKVRAIIRISNNLVHQSLFNTYNYITFLFFNLYT